MRLELCQFASGRCKKHGTAFRAKTAQPDAAKVWRSAGARRARLEFFPRERIRNEPRRANGPLEFSFAHQVARMGRLALLRDVPRVRA
jgi:hypothetical protein